MLVAAHPSTKLMKVTQSESAYLQIACDQITKSVNVEGIAIFLDKNINEKRIKSLFRFCLNALIAAFETF